MSSGSQKLTPTSIFEVVFLGDKGVGKTSLIQKLAEVPNDPTTNVTRTIGSEFLQMNMTLGRSGQQIVAGVRLYDSHFSLFNSPPSLSRRKDIIVIVWSLQDSESFRNMKRQMEEIATHFVETDQLQARPDIIVCANKSDNSKLELQFNTYQIENIKMIHTSTSDNRGIQELTKCIEDLLLTRHFDGQPPLGRSIELSQDFRQSADTRPEPSCC